MKTASLPAWLQTGLLLGIVILLLALWHRPAPAAPMYQISDFHYSHYFTDRAGKTYVTVLRFTDYTFINGTLRGTDSATESAFEVTSILDRLGADGWHLVWSDGEHYIVERPTGKWRHEGFRVSQELQTDATEK